MPLFLSTFKVWRRFFIAQVCAGAIGRQRRQDVNDISLGQKLMYQQFVLRKFAFHKRFLPQSIEFDNAKSGRLARSQVFLSFINIAQHQLSLF